MQRRYVIASVPATLASLAGLLLSACGGKAQSAPPNAANPQGRFATIELDKGGSFTLQMFPEDAPNTVKNFVDKANSGFYNGLTFHRVEDWVVQGGDPSGNGTGGGNMPSEIPAVTPNLKQKPFVVGSVGIARGQDIRINNAAQFFICTKEAGWLNGQYTNFGQVTAGMDVVKGIHVGDKIKRVTIKS